MQEWQWLLDGRYQVIEQLGEGVMARTYLVEDMLVKRPDPLVVKQYKHPVSRTQAINELETHEKLFNPRNPDPACQHLQWIYEVHPVDNEAHVIMEYIPGPTLKVVDAEFPWSIEEWWSFAQSLLSVLELLEKHHLLHRDIKPENIILRNGDRRQPVLTDFGFATPREVTTTEAGTLGYFPPELWASPRPPESSDRYALSVVLFQILTGREPIYKLAKNGYTRIVRMPPSVDEKVRPLAKVLLTAITTDPSERPRSAFELQEQLVEAMEKVYEKYKLPPPARRSQPKPEAERSWNVPVSETSLQTAKKQQDIVKDATFIYGPVQGFVQGEHNTVTLIFPDSKVLTMPFLAPPQPPYNLVGRDELIRELKQQLFHGGNLTLSALNGLPGIGKTALALAIAYDREVLGYFRDGVLWAGLGREYNVFSYLGTWGMALGIPQPEMEKLTNPRLRVEAIRRNIGARRMLLVVDDAWRSEDALAFKLGGPNCAHIVTTRLPEVAERFATEGAITVRELDEDDSLRLLEQLAPGVSAKAPDEIREIIQVVGGLPLPLILMGKYLRIQMKTEQPRRLRTALDRLLQVKERLLLDQPQGGLERHPSLPEGVPLSQLAVIQISDEALDTGVQQALRALSVFPSKPNSFSEEAALAVAATNTQAIDTLLDFGLLESSGPERYTLHQTISDYARVHLADTTAYERMVAFFIEYVEAHKTDQRSIERETSNILAAVQIIFDREMQVAGRGAKAIAYFFEIFRRSRFR